MNKKLPKKSIIFFFVCVILFIIMFCVSMSSSKDNNANINNETSQNSLEQFLISITDDITPDDVETYSEELGLVQTYKSSGTDHITYRVAANKEIADSYKPEKGTVVILEFDKLNNSKLTEVTYFNADKMIQGKYKDGSYTLTDYNNPENDYMNMPITSFADMTAYEPKAYSGNNLLEELFFTISETTTKEDIMNFIEANGLHYTLKGMGNKEYITYDSNVMKKNGDMGSYLSVDFSDDILTHMEYCDYPVKYKTGAVLEFYSNYNYSDLNGFYIVNDDGYTQFDGAQEAIEVIQSLR